ncbi:MAG TPA: tripartite tricarboxylate transporter TctB family protein [Ramlibacter sp.]|jgi:hypothetical protein
MLTLKSPQDLGAAAVFSTVGIAGLYFGAELPGTHADGQLGSGTFPFVLSWICLGFGAISALRAFSFDGPAPLVLPPRPVLAIVASIIAFGLLVERLGYLPVAILTTFLATLAVRGFRWKEGVLVSVLLGAAAAVLFVILLRQPMKLWWGQY